MGTILDKIFDTKKEELEDTRRSLPLATLKTRIREPSAVRDVRPALESSPPHRILAEIKRRTPFKGELRPDFDPLRLARVYAEHGACAISVLTESNYFGGRLEFLSEIRSRVDLPLLRKDFILDEYQVYESRVFGADFYLLIATWLDKNHLADLLALGRELGLSALVETHSEKDMEKAFRADASLIGINNRDLATGKTDLEVSRRLIGMARQVPGTLR
ncbi:MAG: indole-3-glycerol phosphate synthase, partial [Nitrospinaceae bacterium]|nr:indole-3-glycerol-phosphate synthase [Nitrospinaceae bacterium]NIR56949.1 indole-3-glycerol-phosphate synthase [Nitrospinaceae bacterium]NIS87405.1 indole-3-glycerol-phosphate synthase [Nitrospinaceae bacterium]NIT84257.1 indole-3-glycerol-phosphate synthase [Nitrospinaceae bacterium]NIU46445.1 indole-3-glycerol-phosphate synthase [Nitrospinaceae bacterium]